MFILRNTQSFGYNLFPLTSQTVLNYNIYKDDQSGEYDWHIDAESEFENDVKLMDTLGKIWPQTSRNFYTEEGQ